MKLVYFGLSALIVNFANAAHAAPQFQEGKYEITSVRSFRPYQKPLRRLLSPESERTDPPQTSIICMTKEKTKSFNAVILTGIPASQAVCSVKTLTVLSRDMKSELKCSNQGEHFDRRWEVSLEETTITSRIVSTMEPDTEPRDRIVTDTWKYIGACD